MIDKRIILVTDKNEKIINASIANRNLEGNNSFTTNIISKAIKDCSREFEIYTDTELFLKNLYQYKNDIIFPMKYGRNTPDSKSIIPSICEGAGIKYIGADDYAHMICNDKYTSKLYANEFGIKTAPSVLIRNCTNKMKVYDKVKILNLPLVVKPNFGGGSTGISENNVCFNYDDTVSLCTKLYSFHKMPILIEEYIPGREVELIIVGNKNKVHFSEEVQLLMGDCDYYEKEIWGFETKKIDDSSIDFLMSHYISQNDIERIHNLFKSFNKIEFMRVDGRVKDGEFYLIELSPDCYLGDDCAFYYAFQNKGYSLSEMFEYLINNGLCHYQSQIPNILENQL